MRSFLARHLPRNRVGRARRRARLALGETTRLLCQRTSPGPGAFARSVPGAERRQSVSFYSGRAPHFNSGLVAAVACLRQYLGRPLRIVDLGPRWATRLPCYWTEFRAAQKVSSAWMEPGRIGRCSRRILPTWAGSRPILRCWQRGPGNPFAGASSSWLCDGAGREEVEAQTLDALLVAGGKVAPCDLIKIDLDGYDGEVLSGPAKRSFATNRCDF